MMKRCNGSSPIEDVCKLVHELQTELAGSSDHDGGSEDFGNPYNDPGVGPLS
jgi:hypothetical protein